MSIRHPGGAVGVRHFVLIADKVFAFRDLLCAGFGQYGVEGFADGEAVLG